MREHIGLCRGKRIDGGEWVEGGVYCGNFTWIITTDLFGAFKHHLVDPDTVGECTGLTDIGGRSIFEGDILTSHDFDEENGYCVVCWYDGAWEVNNGEWCGTFHDNYNGFEFEIIGNIHDNPELLKGGEADG